MELKLPPNDMLMYEIYSRVDLRSKAKKCRNVAYFLYLLSPSAMLRESKGISNTYIAHNERRENLASLSDHIVDRENVDTGL